MKRVAILIEKFFDEKELIYPYIRLLEEGYEVHLVGTEKNAVYPGKSTFTEKSTHAASEVKADDYDGVVIPGGYSPDHMRRNPHMIEFVKEMDRQGKPIAAICHGPWMMASCCNLKGKKLTGFFAIKDDIVNAGAGARRCRSSGGWEPDNLKNPKDLPAFMKAFIEKVGK